jgi:hypothetical protein
LVVVAGKTGFVEVDILGRAHGMEIAAVLDVAPGTTLLAVAFDAVALIALAVIAMVKRHRVSRAKSGFENDQLFEFHRSVMAVVAGGGSGPPEPTSFALLVANTTGGVTVPLAVAAEAPPVIRALEARLREVLMRDVGGVATLAVGMR